MDFIKEFWEFLRIRKKYWLFPILLTLVLFGALIVLLTFLLFNLGEAGLFSANGYGMLYLIVITSIITRPKLIKKTN